MLIERYAAIIIVWAAATGVAWYHGYTSGQDSYQEKIDAAQEKADRKQEELIAALEDARQNTREKVRTVYVEKDDSGCADTVIPNGVFRQLQGED